MRWYSTRIRRMKRMRGKYKDQENEEDEVYSTRIRRMNRMRR